MAGRVTRYTTPTVTIRCAGVDLTNRRVWVTLAQGAGRASAIDESAVLTLDSAEDAGRLTVSRDGEDTTIVLTLSQEETARLAASRYATAQVNAMDAQGRREASSPMCFEVADNLLREVRTYG